MKKKFIFFTMLLLTLMGGVKLNVLNAEGTQTITIGEGGTLNYGYNPMASNYNYSVSQQIYTKSELSNGLAGVISDITLYVSGVYDANRNIEIWLMNTDKTVFDNNSDWLDLPAENKVFDSNVSLTTGAFTFDISDFTYTGGNLLLCMFDKTGKCPNYSPNTFVHFDAEGVKNVLTVYSDASSSLNNFNPTNINVSGYFTGNSYSPYIKTKVSFTITPIAVEPSVTVTPESIALGTVKVGGEYWTEKPFAPQAVNVKAQGGAVISSVTTTNSFFTFSEEYTGGDNFDFTVGYNKNGDAGTQAGNIVVAYDETTKEVPMTATAYVPATGDVKEKVITANLTSGSYSHKASGMHDDYILPDEENDGNNGDAVYTFTLAKESLITASVTGTHPIVAIYNEDFGEKEGPSSDNNYEGVSNEPAAPSAPTTFFYDFDDGSLEDFNLIDADGDGNNWETMKVYGKEDYIAISYSWKSGVGAIRPNNYLITKNKYYITENSKILFKVNAVNNCPENYSVVIATDVNNIDNYISVYEGSCSNSTPAEIVVELNEYTGTELYIGIRHYNSYNQYNLSINDLQLTDGSAKSRSVAQTRSTNQIDRVLYPAGTYYLVAAAEGDFTLNLSTSELSAPAAATLTAPANEATEQNNPLLTWTLDKFAEEYQLLLGTTNTLTDDDVVVDWSAPATSYQTEGLANNTVYYWQVKSKNSVGESSSEVFSFVTPLNKPTNVTASKTNLYPGDETTISWTEATGAISYNVYVNGTVKDVVSASDNEYRISNPEYNMTNNNNLGDCVQIAAVHEIEGEERESVLSSECYFKVTGYGSFAATVNVEGATMKLEGTDEFGAAQTYEIVADENGSYASDEVLAGSYTATASAFGYNDATATVTVTYNGEANYDFVMIEKPTAPENLLKDVAVAEEYGAAKVTWTGAYNNTQMYNIYRKNVETGVVELVDENQNGTYSISKSYTDAAYAGLDDGTYQYGVTTMVEQNIGFTQGFEDGKLPEGWTVYSNIPSTYYDWTVLSGYNYSSYYYPKTGNYAVYSKTNNTTSGSDYAIYLITPNVEWTSNSKLEFYYLNPYGSFGSSWSNTLKVMVKLSSDNNDEWQIVETYGYATTWTKKELQDQLKSYEGKNINIAFVTNAYCSNCIVIDDITVAGTKLQESAPVWSNTIKKGGIVFTNNNGEGDGKWETESNWSNGEVPANDGTAEVTIKAAATISSEVDVKYLAINGGSLTLESTAVLTADELINNDEYTFIIKDGAQLFHNNTGVKASFTMGIVNPEGEGEEVWNENNKTGWQFIASPFTGAAVDDFVPTQGNNYDLYRYAGSADEEWDNHKDNHLDQSWWYFNPGEGYLASYDKLGEATLRGTLNSGVTYSWDNLTYDNSKDLAKFHLVGNPFTFNMEWNKVAQTNMVEGYAVLNDNGSGYIYMTEGTVAVGDAFFVKAKDENPSMSYNAASKATRGEKANSLNVIATGNAGKDNVVINFAGKSEGFNKLQNFNDAIATVYVAEDGKNYGIYNCDADVQEVELRFNANQMGNYTISIEPNGKFQSVTLVDRFTGIETNMLVEDYNFTAMSNVNANRFIVRMVNGQESTDNSHFVYQSGEELIIDAEGTVQIIDVMGRVLVSDEVESTNNRINVSGFQNGTYMVRVINGSEVKVEKVVIY